MPVPDLRWLCVFGEEGAASVASLGAALSACRLDDFAAVDNEADTRLAGLGLLVRGRHAFT